MVIRRPLLPVLGNESLLTQAIGNLVANAAKFVPAGKTPRLEIWTEKRAGNRVRLLLQDNGIGIRPEHQSRIFGLFERIHGKGEFEGTGIGLAIVRKAVDRMRGSLGVESDGVNGSTFWIELPAPDEELHRNPSR